jgi:tRNA(His) 5'-end guanylyltransferase
MKKYENISNHYLMFKTPVILRLDGKNFHSYTKKLQRPFDYDFINLMAVTATKLCENIAGAKLAYVQSDEISILLTDFNSLNTEPWFNNRVQKLTSVSASLCSVIFNKEAPNILGARLPKHYEFPVFDCRTFNLPEHEVNNYFVFRQKDAERNSLNMFAQAHFSHKELQGKKAAAIHDMLMSIGLNWNDLPVQHKRGTCIVKTNAGWQSDINIPIFTKDTEYVSKYIR